MSDKLGKEIEVLGLSTEACEALKKCNIATVQDLMLLINSKLVSDSLQSQESTVCKDGDKVSMKDAILHTLKEHPNTILDCEEIRRGLIKEYGDRVSSNIGSIKQITLMMAYEGKIERAESGKYFYNPNSNFSCKEKKKTKRSPGCPYQIPLREAIPKVIKAMKGPFNHKTVREALRKKYGNRVSTNKSSIKTKFSELLSEGRIKRIETGDYIYCSNPDGATININNKVDLDSFIRSHIGKEIEFRYKSNRSYSEKRWRRETVWMHDDKYLYIEKKYKSGQHVIYLKERIVEYREPNGA